MPTVNRHYPAIEGELEFESEFEDEYEGQAEAEFEFEFEAEAETAMHAEGELEDEFEAEDEDEAEGFANPVRRVYRDAELMAHLSSQAAHAEGEDEAEAFLGALIPLASRLIPRAASLIAHNAPTLIRGATRLGRQLRRNPRTRRLVQTLPVIVQRTVQSLADQSQNGTDLSPSDVLGTFGRIAGTVLAPQRRHRALRAVGVFDRRYHRRAQWSRSRARRYRPSYRPAYYGAYRSAPRRYPDRRMRRARRH